MSALFSVVWIENGQNVSQDDLEIIALCEKWAEGLVYCDMEGLGFAMNECGALILLDECGNYVRPPKGLFRVEWAPRP